MRATLAFLSVILLSACSSHPTDEEMEAEYSANKDAYDALADMAEADGDFSRISYDFVHPDWNLAEDERPLELSVDRWAEYRRQFEELGLESGVTIYDDAVVLEKSSSGSITAGSSKGFLRSATLPEGIALVEGNADLGCDLANAGSCSVAKRLEGNWFLILERH